jgi:hypothetical protein
VGTESNFPLPKFVTLGGDCIDGNISGRFDNADGVIGFTLDISEPDESEDVFVADGVGERGEVGVEDGTGVADGLGNCPAPQPEIHMPRTKMETIAIHAFVFIFLFSDSASRAAQRFGSSAAAGLLCIIAPNLAKRILFGRREALADGADVDGADVTRM